MPGLPVVDTVKRVDADGAIVETLDAFRAACRADAAGLRRGRAPAALERLDGDGLRLGASRRRRARVLVVDGDPRLLKVTTPDDLALVESWLGHVE